MQGVQDETLFQMALIKMLFFPPIILTFIVIASEIICTTDKVRVYNPVIRDHLQALSLRA